VTGDSADLIPETWILQMVTPGFDRNLFTVQAVPASIDYIHNPVARGLCCKARGWPWSSARLHESEGRLVDPVLPTIMPLPAEFRAGR
jgi:hypothetical protein